MAKISEQKLATWHFVKFHNNSPMLTMESCNSSTCAIVAISCVSTWTRTVWEDIIFNAVWIVTALRVTARNWGVKTQRCWKKSKWKITLPYWVQGGATRVAYSPYIFSFRIHSSYPHKGNLMLLPATLSFLFLKLRLARTNCEFDVTKSLLIICESSISYLYSSGRLPRSLGDIGRCKIHRCWCTRRWGHIHLFRHLHTRQYLHRDRKRLPINLHNVQVLSDSHFYI